MAAAAVFESRKRHASPFLDEAAPAPAHLAGKRGRFSPYPPGLAAALQKEAQVAAAFDPLDALRRVFPDADPREVEACFADSGRDINRTVGNFRARQAKEAVAARLSHAAARADGVEECAGLLVEQMSAAADVADARSRASWMLSIITNAVAERAAAGLREENAALRAQAESSLAGLREENAEHAADAARLKEENAALTARAAALGRDNAVLKHGVVALHKRHEETERAAAELKKKAAELEMANYAMGIRLRDADNCRFQAFRGPDAF